MKKLAATVLLIAALVLPVLLFLLVKSRASFNDLAAAGIAIPAGWATSVAWASVAVDLSEPSSNTLSTAVRFGWICPSVLVLVTWLISRLAG